ncbi:MAG: hypothetical protein RLZZ546_2867, partial [Bacteroidota bacterium]
QFLWKNFLAHKTEKSVSTSHFTFSLAQFKVLLVDEKEFKFQDKMYDIVNAKIEKDTIKIEANEDSFESKLIHILSNALSHKDFNIDDLIKKILSFVFLIPNISCISNVSFPIVLEDILFRTFHSSIWIHEILKPPC